MKKINMIIAGTVFAGLAGTVTANAADVTVKSGDTLSEIAIANKTTVANLKKLNGLSSTNIRIGQKIKVSATAVGTSKTAQVVNCAYLNVRSSASTSSKIVAVAKKGEKVQVISNNGQWAHISLGGKKGYASSKYLKGSTGATAATASQTGFITKSSAIFHHPGSWKAGTINPQRVQIIEKRTDGWMKINTWKGAMWVKNGVVNEYYYVNKTAGLFKAPGKEKVSSITPQRTLVLQRTNDGWVRISTWKGPLWVKNGVVNETIYLTKTSGLYKTPGKSKVTAIGPQKATVVQRTSDGWARISTWKGMLWVKNGFNTNNVVKAIGPAPKKASSTAIFNRPTDATAITSNYGERWGRIHYGMDYAGNGDQRILAAAGGKVTRSYVHPSWGEVIFISHNIGGKRYDTIYAHLRKGSRNVFVGDTVKTGQFIGWMGSTGNSTGQHLHFEVHPGGYKSPSRSAVNPSSFVK